MIDTNVILQVVLLAVEATIHTLSTIDGDLFGAVHFVPNAIGTAREDLKSALYSLHDARSWAKDAMAFDKSTPIEKLPRISPIDTALSLLSMVFTILERERRYPLPPLNGDESEPDTERQRAIDKVLNGLNIAFEALEHVQAMEEAEQYEELPEAV